MLDSELFLSQISHFLEKTIEGQLPVAVQIEFLNSLPIEELYPEQLELFVRFLKKQMTQELSLKGAIDICGTGGSGLPRINTSTISAFLLAALGVPVAKHGNRAASGRFGSFDLLESLDIQIEKKPSELEYLFKSTHLAFLYARTFHPSMKHFVEARQKIAKPTVFNLLGPLLNPASVKRQIIGTTFIDHMELLAETCRQLGQERVIIVAGEDGLDEVTLTGKTHVVELRDGEYESFVLTPADFGIQEASFEEIKGGNAQYNTDVAQSILAGECRSRHEDLVLVNTALALYLADVVSDVREGYQIAKKALREGLAYQKYLEYRQLAQSPSILLEIIAHKKAEVMMRQQRQLLAFGENSLHYGFEGVPHSQRDFKAALLQDGISIIGEIKKTSPSTADFIQADRDIKELAKTYESAGIDAISVLTDHKFFKGTLDYLTEVLISTDYAPLLCKDFIVEDFQIYEARYFGADAILLIAAVLTDTQLREFSMIAKNLSMDVLCEVHNEVELNRVLAIDPDIIGINNRDLHTFEIDHSTTARLVPLIPEGIVIVAESGISSHLQVRNLPKRVDAILVGTSIMQAHSVTSQIHSLKLQRPLFKACGIRSVEEAQFCEAQGVDLVGLNFVPSSKRCISVDFAERVCDQLTHARSVGVFQNQSLDEVHRIADAFGLDFVQLSGDESLEYVKSCRYPVIKAFSLDADFDLEYVRQFLPHCAFILFDGPMPGSGLQPAYDQLMTCDFPFLIAGGISPENCQAISAQLGALGVDVASGIETDGAIDLNKISQILNLLNS